jgi:DEAD/DEAH box helicase domain-containing protein
VKELNLERKHAYVEKGDYDYYTQSIDRAQIRVEEVELEGDWRVAKVGFGDVNVTEMVIMFRKIKFGSSDSIGFGNLDLPAYTLETSAMWIVPPRQALDRVRESGRSPQDGLLGIGNVLAAVMPLFTMSDRQDVSVTMDSMNFGSPTIFLYDKYPGGAGFAQRAYDRVEELMTACLELVASCDCEDGCPSCVGASEADWGRIGDSLQRSAIPDKEAALCILHHLLEREPYIPKPLHEQRPQRGAEGPAQAELEAAPPPVPAPREVKRLPAAVENRIRRRLSDLGR